MLRRAARRRSPPSCSTAWPASALRFPLPPVGGRLPRLLRRRPDGAAPPATFVAPLASDDGGLVAEAATPDCARRPSSAARRSGRAPHRRPGGPDRAVQEHRARHAGFRGAPGRPPEWRGRGRPCGATSIPPGRAWPTISPRRRRRCTRPSASTTSAGHDGWTPIILPVEDDRPRSLAALDPLRRPAGQPGARRPQPRGQGGPVAQPVRRGPGALARGRRVGGARPGRRRGARRQPLRRRRRRPMPSTRRSRMGLRERAGRAGALRDAVRGPRPRPTGGRTSWRRRLPPLAQD